MVQGSKQLPLIGVTERFFREVSAHLHLAETYLQNLASMVMICSYFEPCNKHSEYLINTWVSLKQHVFLCLSTTKQQQQKIQLSSSQGASTYYLLKKVIEHKFPKMNLLEKNCKIIKICEYPKVLQNYK